jgi:hypothetical protein
MAILKNPAMDALFSAMLTRVGVSAAKWATLTAEQQGILFNQFVRDQLADPTTRAAMLAAIQGVL